MNKTNIEWADVVWQPVTGCKHRCPYCYAERYALTRLKHHPRYKNGFEPTFHPDALLEPDEERRPRKIFVCSMGDLFGRWIPRDWILMVLRTVYHNPHHTFIFLTKNPGRYRSLSPWPANAWIGATATDQKSFEEKYTHLAQAKASVRFISFEPLLGPIRIPRHLEGSLEWVIIGAMTGPGAIKPDLRWVHELTEDAQRIGAAIFHKDNLGLQQPRREYPRI